MPIYFILISITNSNLVHQLFLIIINKLYLFTIIIYIN
ncbi:methyltransferase [Clostridium scatologenes]|uniref:Methyltransferase n=1 Tax=Clostridium scatologenes TaxID=1548 RepID=A0A0E3JQR9_CLOSL|nr:methyltransferase [Clostridium scatologenes]